MKLSPGQQARKLTNMIEKTDESRDFPEILQKTDYLSFSLRKNVKIDPRISSIDILMLRIHYGEKEVNVPTNTRNIGANINHTGSVDMICGSAQENEI
mgnify:CR=1 FL=1